MRLVEEIEQLKRVFKVSYMMIFKAVPLNASTYRRWRCQVRSDKEPVKKPGPKPLKPLNLQKLDTELKRLDHGPKRSRGIGNLRGAMRGSISRRGLDEIIIRARQDKLRKERAEQCRLNWHQSGSAWSMDVFEIRTPPSYRKNFVLSVQDLASGYKLPPLTSGSVPKGLEITRHLGRLFKEFGRPLFLKRDNGGNLNHSSMTELLAENHVLPLNSPCHYAPYNGAIEHAQGEFKRRLTQNHNYAASCREFALSTELTAHDLNHVCRRKLQGNTSCSRFFKNPRFNYPNRKRQEVFLWIYNRAVDIMEQAGKNVSQSSAWRIACKLWLMKNDLLSISKNDEVLPPLSGKTAHN